MKFSTALVLGGVAVASAATIPRDSCPAVQQKVQLTWVETKVFEAGKAKTWSFEDAKKKMGNSKFDPSQVYKNLNSTYPGKAASSKPAGYPASKATSTAKPYPTLSAGTNGTYTSTGLPSRVTGSATVAASSSAEAYTTTTSSTSSAEPSETLQVWPCTNPATRYEWRNLNDGQRDAYVSAVRCLINRPSGDSNRFPGSRNRYEDFVSLHQQLTPSIHMTGSFLPWHRYFLHVYEDVLRSECGYNGPLIWWDETLDAGNFARAPMMTTRWMGQLPGPRNGQGVCVTQTGFGNYQPNIGPGNAINNPHCLSRAVDEGLTSNVNQGWVDSCRQAGNYNDHRECSEFGPHAYGHNGIGAVMSDVSPSPSDPLFYLHHGFVDRNWKAWQNDAWWNRVYEIGGPTDQNGNGWTTPSDVLTSLGIRPDVTIADVLDTEAAYLCYVYDRY